MKFNLTAKWQFLHFLICFPNWEEFHDKKNCLSFYILQHASLAFTLYYDGKLTKFLHSPARFSVVIFSLTANWQFLLFSTCFLIVKCSVTENGLSIYIFQHVSPSWSAAWQKTDSGPTFSSMLPFREVFLDNKVTQFQRLDDKRQTGSFSTLTNSFTIDKKVSKTQRRKVL